MRRGIYLTLVNEVGKIVWVSDTLPGVIASEVVGQLVWDRGPPTKRRQIRDAFHRAVSGEKVSHWSSRNVAGKPRYYRTVWQRAELVEGALLLLTTLEVQPEFRKLSKGEQHVS